MHCLRAAFILLVASALAACRASYPSQPTSASVLALQVHYRSAMGPALVGSGFAFRAYTVDSDGVFEDVTSKATWSSSNSGVAALTTAPSGFSAFAPGLADISATYRGMASAVTVTVVEPDREFPVLKLGLGDPQFIGLTSATFATLMTSRTQGVNVTGSAAWSSSDPSVAAVRAGHVTAVGAGTARITATFNGLSASYGLSVQP